MSLNSSANLSAKCTNQFKWLHESISQWQNTFFSSSVDLLDRQTDEWMNEQHKDYVVQGLSLWACVCNWIQIHLDSRGQDLKIHYIFKWNNIGANKIIQVSKSDRHNLLQTFYENPAFRVTGQILLRDHTGSNYCSNNSVINPSVHQRIKLQFHRLNTS